MEVHTKFGRSRELKKYNQSIMFGKSTLCISDIEKKVLVFGTLSQEEFVHATDGKKTQNANY